MRTLMCPLNYFRASILFTNTNMLFSMDTRGSSLVFNPTGSCQYLTTVTLVWIQWKKKTNFILLPERGTTTKPVFAFWRTRRMCRRKKSLYCSSSNGISGAKMAIIDFELHGFKKRLCTPVVCAGPEMVAERVYRETHMSYIYYACTCIWTPDCGENVRCSTDT